MYKTEKKTRQVLDLRWYKSVDDGKFYLEQLIKTSEYIYNDDPHCPQDLKLTEVSEEKWERIPYILEGIGEVTP